MKKLIILGVAIIFVMTFIIVMSNQDVNSSDSQSKKVVMEIVNKYDKITNADNETLAKHQTKSFIEEANHFFRKFSHAFIYFVLGILVLDFLITLNKSSFYLCNLYSLLFVFIYACTDEYHQTFVAGRTGKFSDVLIDSVGALIGCIIFSVCYILIMKRKRCKMCQK